MSSFIYRDFDLKNKLISVKKSAIIKWVDLSLKKRDLHKLWNRKNATREYAEFVPIGTLEVLIWHFGTFLQILFYLSDFDIY